MKTNYKKMLKFVILMVSSLLIATVSAETYTYLFIKGSITVAPQAVFWIHQGSIVSGSVAQPSFTVQQGLYTWYNDTLYLKNIGSSVSVSITVTNPAPSTVFEICNVYVYENFTTSGIWTLVGTLNALTNSALQSKELAQNGYFKFNFEIQAKTTASPDTYSFEITVVY